MAKILSFLSWNVENFSNKPARVERVVDKIAAKSPDVFGLYEVKGAAVFQALTSKMPGYSFFITESPGIPEILVGTKSNISSFVTQKDELQSKVPSLRPGALATITVDSGIYSFLFLHLKSFPKPRDWGLRDDMFEHVSSLKRTLDGIAPGDQKSNFVALGDLNTMGLSAPYNNDSDFDGAQELAYVDKRMSATRNGMKRLSKTHEVTWWNGSNNYDESNLDHVYASNHLNFKSFGGDDVEVTGWVGETTKTKKRAWINKYSDHCLLYGEIHD